MSTKNNILKILEENRNKSISGQEMAQMLSVSRSAVWKAIKSLQDEGYKIEGVNNKGYRLSSEADLISEQGLRIYLNNENGYNDIEILQSVVSTNDYIKQSAVPKINSSKIVIAREQTVGKGRAGKSFYSPANTGIYMSIAHSADIGIADVPIYTLIATVAVCLAVEKLTDLTPKIKWVNDVLVDGKKVCGILTEAVVSDFEGGKVDFLVVGIGLNVETEIFPDYISQTAASISPKGVTKNEITAEIINNFFKLAKPDMHEYVVEEYKNRSLILGRRITYKIDEKIYTARVLDINKKGGLIAENGDQTTLSIGNFTILSID